MRLRSALITFAIAFAAIPLAAQSNDVGLWVAGDRVTSTSSDPTTQVHFTHGRGFGLSANHYWCSHFSTELMGTSLRHNGSLFVNGDRAFGIGHLDLRVITLAGQLHMNHEAAFDPYLSVGAAHVSARDLKSSDLNLAGIGNVKINSKTTWTAGVGANFSCMKSLGLSVDAKYIRYRPNSGTSSSAPLPLKLNPIVVSAGLKFRF